MISFPCLTIRRRYVYLSPAYKSTDLSWLPYPGATYYFFYHFGASRAIFKICKINRKKSYNDFESRKDWTTIDRHWTFLYWTCKTLKYLKSSNCGRLKAEIGLEVLSDLTNKSLKGKFADQKLGRFLVTADLTESDCSWTVTVRLLDTSSWGCRFTGSLINTK